MSLFYNLKAEYDIYVKQRYKRTRKVPVSGQPGNYHIRSESDYMLSIEIARDIDRNDMVVGQGITRFIRNALRDGIALDPNTGDRGLDIELTDRWETWGSSPEQCSWNQQLSWFQIESMALRSVIVDGDIFALPLRDDGRVKILEGHRCRSSNHNQNGSIFQIVTGKQDSC